MSDPVLGLLDRRRRQLSHRTAPAPKFSGSCSSIARGIRTSNVRHFLHVARRDHGVTLSYTFVKLALQVVAGGRVERLNRTLQRGGPCPNSLGRWTGPAP
jgi:hypothetical protein